MCIFAITILLPVFSAQRTAQLSQSHPEISKSQPSCPTAKNDLPVHQLSIDQPVPRQLVPGQGEENVANVTKPRSLHPNKVTLSSLLFFRFSFFGRNFKKCERIEIDWNLWQKPKRNGHQHNQISWIPRRNAKFQFVWTIHPFFESDFYRGVEVSWLEGKADPNPAGKAGNL